MKELIPIKSYPPLIYTQKNSSRLNYLHTSPSPPPLENWTEQEKKSKLNLKIVKWLA